jgi:hypothetical protein
VAYNHPRKWNAEDVEIKLIDEASERDVATVKVSVGGAALFIMGEIREDGKRLVLGGVHVSSEGVNPNEVGVPNLRQVARAIMEIGGYDEIVVEGAVRTTGAHPGHRPGTVRFSREPAILKERREDFFAGRIHESAET